MKTCKLENKVKHVKMSKIRPNIPNYKKDFLGYYFAKLT